MISAAEFLKWVTVFNIQQGSRSGTVTSVATGTGLTGGTITTSGTISFAAIPAGTFWLNNTAGSAVPTPVAISSVLAPYLPLAGGTMTGALNMGGFGITNVPTPSAATDAVNKSYADAIAGGLNPVDAVQGASTANLTGWTYNNGTAGVGATLTAPSIGLFAPDGVSLSVGDRWLYKNDTDGSGAYNGIYAVSVNSVSAQAVLTRWSGYDTPTEIQKGDLVSVEAGTVNAGSSYVLTSQPVTIGVSAINYSAFFTPSTYLQVANNLFDVGNKTTAFNNISPLTTKGDLIVYGTGNTRLAIGSDGTFLQALSSQSLGMQWSPYTLPTTTLTANQLLYCSSVSAVTGLATANSAVLVTDASGVPSLSTTLPLGISATGGALPAQGRLTLTSGTPVTTSDVTAATTLYFTPYRGNTIALYDGSSKWNILTFSEISIPVPAAANACYDVFAYNNSGVVACETLAWSTTTARATAIVLQNGIYVKSGATTRRYLGSFCTTGVSGQTEDSFANRFVWNYYNRVARPLTRTDPTASWTYSLNVVRQANANTANQLNFMIGVVEDLITSRVLSSKAQATTGSNGIVSIGLDSTTVKVANSYAPAAGAAGTDGTLKTVACIFVGYSGIGKHYLAWLESGDGNATTTWFSNSQSGIQAEILG